MNPHTIILPATTFTQYHHYHHHQSFITNTEVLGGKPVPVPLCQSQFPHTGLRLNPDLHGKRQATTSHSENMPQ